MSNKEVCLPSAYEFLKERNYQKARLGWIGVDTIDLYDFAKMHVEAALKEASQHARGSVKEKILNCYPIEDNIK